MAYFAVDKKNDSGKFKFAGFIQAKSFVEANNKLFEIGENYQLYGYGIIR